ncbi:Frataxin [Auriscalpium vulgare]|uniref:Frataxin n=1 Tax=Auriscalpium vulgare TaxID=40419 RepID=A0ACB8RWU8_9AGAM|nr:Frataxin [Auriscalpium vulgare]
MFSRNIPRLLAQRSIVYSRHLHAARPPRASTSALQIVQRRHMATPPPQVNVNAELSVEQYHEYSEEYMDSMLDSLEAFVDKSADPSYEVEYSSGVLTLSLGPDVVYVINKQPPNKQIWLSSPHSGPKRYDYSRELDDWVYSRDGRTLGSLLNEELSTATKEKVDLGLGPGGNFRASREHVPGLAA